ncbi:hypothetical protein [Lacticaseibacillus hegangensis]|uniref:ABC transporter permease n=1 Tax=Lacticaseibacillus hegangensis TaxID=2486010 RepID=A0ABW4CZQ1_9LACO|nr:hypothetical protein [Lacticaseibacillus hegangensis]
MIDAKKIVRTRHHELLVLLILAAGLTLAIFGLNYRQTFHGYASRPTESQYLDSQRENVRQLRKEGDRQAARDAAHESYASFVKSNYQLYFHYGNDPMPTDHNGLTVNIYFILAAYAVGVLVAAMDGLGGFDRFLAGLGIARRKLYWAKMRVFLPLIGGLSLAVPGLMLILFYLTFPARLINLTATGMLAILVYNFALTVTAFIFGHTLGQLIGRPLVLAVGATLLIPLLANGLEHATVLWSALTHWLNIGGSFLRPGEAYWWLLAGCLVVSGGAAWLGARLYRSVSMERRRTLLTAPHLRWPLVIGVTLLLTLNFGTVGAHGLQPWPTLVWPLLGLAVGLAWQFWPAVTAVTRRLQRVD